MSQLLAIKIFYTKMNHRKHTQHLILYETPKQVKHWEFASLCLSAHLNLYWQQKENNKQCPPAWPQVYKLPGFLKTITENTFNRLKQESKQLLKSVTGKYNT